MRLPPVLTRFCFVADDILEPAVPSVTTNLDGMQDSKVFELNRLHDHRQRMMTHPKPVSKDYGIALVVTQMAGGG